MGAWAGLVFYTKGGVAHDTPTKPGAVSRRLAAAGSDRAFRARSHPFWGGGASKKGAHAIDYVSGKSPVRDDQVGLRKLQAQLSTRSGFTMIDDGTVTARTNLTWMVVQYN